MPNIPSLAPSDVPKRLRLNRKVTNADFEFDPPGPKKLLFSIQGGVTVEVIVEESALERFARNLGKHYGLQEPTAEGSEP